MSNLIRLLTILLSGTACAMVSAEEVSRYMGGPVELMEAPNGAITNIIAPTASAEIMYMEPTVEEVMDGVWSIGGFSVANTTVIEGDDGLIVYDTGDTREEGEHIRRAIEKISDKPVKVIIYSHSHYAFGAGALVDDPADVMIIGHPTLNETVETNLQGGGSPSAIPEVGPIMTPRLLVQFNNFLPEEGPDAALVGKLELGKPIAFLPANKTVEDGEVLELLGLKVQFFTEFLSDDYSLTVWLPEKGVAMNNFFWPGTPNLYSLRGGVYRDPMIWRDGLKLIRDLQPEALLNSHTRPVVGKQLVQQRLVGYMDQITLTYDQTLRGMLQGLGPDDLRNFIYIPPHMQEIPENAQVYGETTHFPEAIYQYVIGWFDGDVTQLFRVPPHEEAKRLVSLAGGKSKVIAAARRALNDQEFAWGAQLVQYVYLLEPQNTEVRQLKADLLRQMGHRTTGSIARAFLITEALALEGKVDVPTVMPPSPAVVAAAPDVFVDYFRVRIDPRQSQDTDQLIQFVFPETDGLTVGLHVRRGVAEFIPNPAEYYREADAILEIHPQSWADVYLGADSLESVLAGGKARLLKGERSKVIKTFSMFDAFSADL